MGTMPLYLTPTGQSLLCIFTFYPIDLILRQVLGSLVFLGLPFGLTHSCDMGELLDFIRLALLILMGIKDGSVPLGS